MASDASQTGGAVGFAEELTIQGADFLSAAKVSADSKASECPVLVLSLFNGIGGAFRCYDIIGVLPMVRIAVERDPGANRVTSRRWPGTIIIDDVHKLSLDMMHGWSRQFLKVQEIHVWAGWPCVDLSAVRAYRQNLDGPSSGLFWLIPPILQNLAAAFGASVNIKYVLENVASMDEAAAKQISDTLGVTPYFLDPSGAVPMRRPRFCWTTESVEGVLTDVTVAPKRYWNEIECWADFPCTDQWLTPGYRWDGEQSNTIFPTAMKSLPRTAPPPKPAGISKCTQECIQRWTEDEFRFPPYQYALQYLITTDSTWRLLSPTEKELLLGYGFNHTRPCWAASRVKGDKVGYIDARLSYLGDSFSVYSFVVMAAACCKAWLPRLPYSLLARRMGLAPERIRQRRHINLDDAALTEATKRRYYAALRKVLPVLEHTQVVTQLDDNICDWIHYMWESGEPLLTIGDALSALHFFQPWTKRQVPRSWKLFSVWRKLEIPCRAPPLTEELVFSMAGFALARADLEMAAVLTLSFHCLLRTGEALQVTVEDLLLGSDSGICRLQGTKSGQRFAANEAISITDFRVLDILKALQDVRSHQPLQQVPIWSRSAAQFRFLFRSLTYKFGIEAHAFRPYSLRRGGATALFQATNSMEAALLRGRWASAHVAKIYISDGLSHLPKLRMTKFTQSMINKYHL
eukprot:Skav208029  [mRNA]  locus=scaffold2714:526222:528848:- [translate_table: standard]